MLYIVYTLFHVAIRQSNPSPIVAIVTSDAWLQKKVEGNMSCPLNTRYVDKLIYRCTQIFVTRQHVDHDHFLPS